MKKFFLGSFLVLFLGLYSCKSFEQPEFKGIENVSLLDLEQDEMQLEADAIMYNPNGIAATVKEIYLKVYIGENEVASMTEEMNVKAPSKENFAIPVKIRFAKKKIYNNIMEGLISILSSKKVNLNYQGHIKVKALGVTWKVPMRQKQELKL
ncbi:LEA type 2 family protein [Rapidithrix thailandica]|uniref:LEA type 2 family protein n=1 Tax=Rapidithrix thailandica TaxID=413964 RepID=A0AAW9S3V1_9BACT